MKRKFVLAMILTLFTLIILMQIQSHLSSAKGSADPIPEDAIRLRILANSNSAADQAVKHQIRDAVNADVRGWVQDLKSSQQAKKVIKAHLGEVRQTVAQKLNKMGLDETFTVKLGPADFPTKMYGGYVYPAGKYEALVITLGKGDGANWWCVLFPPLCFLDFSNGDAVKTDEHQQKAEKHTTQQGVKIADDGNKKSEGEKKDKPEVKFFLVDVIEDIGHFFSHLF
ncbi:hypothetical protein GCM10011391_03890 [Pullulanibacillus camelliae]|uniref:Stage II sporulation protein R n=1 Tax=Pullulanibacillus camelliae TaxID=1707096 RepID=A0A8J2YEH8_9BACL|nr:stage II sporulation protein R [Pullulanibacillus camelliae]GGE28539.1 hypothetical protein GCM10011391_03890 [Pullulanibacillus camelliae]